MRKIKKQESLTLNVGEGAGQEVTFDAFIFWLLDTQKKFNETIKGGRVATRIESAVKSSEGKDYFLLEEAEWTQLCGSAQKPDDGKFMIQPTRRLLGWIDALLGAEQTQPE